MNQSLQQFGGNWTDQKLQRVREYLIAYQQALKNQRFILEYIDAFAGTGYNTPSASADNQSSLFADLVSPDTRRFVDGSARIALQIPRPFDRYVFVERDPRRFLELDKLKEQFPAYASRIVPVKDEANSYLEGLCRSRNWIQKNIRAVVFLDPFGMQVTWRTLQSAPSQRLATLRAACDAGLHVYVAVAPTYPECDETDLRATLEAVAELRPITIFHEPINIRADNVERIQAHADELGQRLNTRVFETRESWQTYAVNSLQTVERLAKELGIDRQLHLWPDKSLGNVGVVSRMPKPQVYSEWLRESWSRVSEWPS